jgi:hypothetical protein
VVFHVIPPLLRLSPVFGDQGGFQQTQAVRRLRGNRTANSLDFEGVLHGSRVLANKPPLDLVFLRSAIALTSEMDLAVFAKVVVDRVRNKVADPAIFAGTNLLNELKPVRQEKDRCAYEACRGSLPSLSVDGPRPLGGAECFGSEPRGRHFFISVRMSHDWQFTRHNMAPRNGSGQIGLGSGAAFTMFVSPIGGKP